MAEQQLFPTDPTDPPAPTVGPAGPYGPQVEVRRSARRRRTVSAYRQGGRTIVLIPSRMSRAEEARWVTTMVERLARQEHRSRPSDAKLAARADILSERWLQGRARPTSVRWSAAQQQRWGSCTVNDGSIRLATRLQGMPAWVVDSVLLHELAHLLEASHGPAFWALLADFPDLERAKAFLAGVSWADRQDGESAGPQDAEDCEMDVES